MDSEPPRPKAEPLATSLQSNSGGINFHQVRAFLTVAEHHSITSAAPQLRMTQSGLSRLVRTLELTLGTSLFHRQPNGLNLTDAGHAFVPYARRLQDCYLAALPNDVNRRASKSVTLGGSYSVLSAVLPVLLAQVARETAKQTLLVQERPCHEIPQLIVNRKADLGLCMCTGVHPDILSIPLLSAPLGLLASQAFKLRLPIGSLEALSNLPLARLQDDMLIPQTLRSHGVAFEAYFSSHIASNSISALLTTVAQSRLVTLVSAVEALDAHHRGLQFVPLPDLLPRVQLSLIGRADSLWQKTHADWMKAIRACVHSAAWPGEVIRL